MEPPGNIDAYQGNPAKVGPMTTLDAIELGISYHCKKRKCCSGGRRMDSFTLSSRNHGKKLIRQKPFAEGRTWAHANRLRTGRPQYRTQFRRSRWIDSAESAFLCGAPVGSRMRIACVGLGIHPYEGLRTTMDRRYRRQPLEGPTDRQLIAAIEAAGQRGGRTAYLIAGIQLRKKRPGDRRPTHSNKWRRSRTAGDLVFQGG